MARKSPTDAPDAADDSITDDAYFSVQVSGRFKAFGVGFGPQSETQVTGALLKKLRSSEYADKITGYTPV